MKRAILLSSLALSIIGTFSYFIVANVEGNKDLKMTMDYVIGDKSSLGEVELKQEIFKGMSGKKTLLINKDGVKDEGLRFNLKNDLDEGVKDRTLYRGMEWGCFNENEDIAVLVGYMNKKGVEIRYKKDGEYKKFILKNDVIKEKGGRIYDAYLKDEESYFIYQNGFDEMFLITVNVLNETIVETIKMPTKSHMNFIARKESERKFAIKDNKIYMPALDIDNNIRLFCYDISSKKLIFKDIDSEKEKAHTNYHLQNNKVYLVNDNEKWNIEINSYDIIKDEKMAINVKLPLEEAYNYISIDGVKETEELIHLCGTLTNINQEKLGYIMAIDKTNNTIKYFAKLNDCSNLNYRLMIQ